MGKGEGKVKIWNGNGVTKIVFDKSVWETVV